VCKSRKRKHINARKVYCIILRDKGYTYTSIGQDIGRDHATALHHYNSKEGCLLTDKMFAEKYYTCLTTFNKAVKKADEVHKGIEDNTFHEKISKLNQELQACYKENEYLNIRAKSLEKKFASQKGELEVQINKYNVKNEELHRMIEERTKPNTQDYVRRKLNAFYNGVYSEVIECY